MRKNTFRILAAAIVLLISQGIWASEGPEPEVLPYCQSPQVLAPMQLIEFGNTDQVSPVAWNGKEYAVLYDQAGTIYFKKYYSDGTTAGNPVAIVSSGLAGATLSMVFNGSGYSIAYESIEGGYFQIFFAKLSLTGNITYGPVRISFYGQTPYENCTFPALAFSGSGYCVTWSDMRTGSDGDIYATLLNADGSVSQSDIVVCGWSMTQARPRVAYSLPKGKYQIVWQDHREGTRWQVFGRQLDSGGGLSPETVLASDVASCYHPDITDCGNGLGLVWVDFRNAGDANIYFVRVVADGSSTFGPQLKVTGSSSTYSDSPRIVWNGAEYGVFWSDNENPGPGNNLWFQRVTSSGTLAGSNISITAVSEINNPMAAFGRTGYMVTGIGGYPSGPQFLLPLGCNYDYSPPSCPTNLLAYNVSGTQATISWGLSGDNETDMAYYIVYRNNGEIAKTANNYYTDTGLSTGTTYNYMVQPVNAMQLQNYACGTSIYTKTSSSFTLMLDKSSDPDAHLYWNDGGMNNYNIFRGTSPQVMSLIGSTSGQSADDSNVLLDRNNYFYTVDDPGQ